MWSRWWQPPLYLTHTFFSLSSCCLSGCVEASPADQGEDFRGRCIFQEARTLKYVMVGDDHWTCDCETLDPSEANRQSSCESLNISSECEASSLPHLMKEQREEKDSKRNRSNYETDKTVREWRAIFRVDLAPGVFSLSHFCLFELNHPCLFGKSPLTPGEDMWSITNT